jgi:hypothetical protein
MAARGVAPLPPPPPPVPPLCRHRLAFVIGFANREGDRARGQARREAGTQAWGARHTGQARGLWPKHREVVRQDARLAERLLPEQTA